MSSIPKYKSPPKKRSMDEGNIKIKEKMDSYVDEMYKYKPSHSYHASIRFRLSGVNSGIKSFFETQLERNNDKAILLEHPTNYGTVTIQKNRNMNCSAQHLIKEALDEMDIDSEQLYASKKFSKKQQYNYIFTIY